jgi:hypothetical protein
VKKEKYIFAQKPNLPIIVWFITFLLLFLPLPRFFEDTVSLISFGAIFTWAWLEIFEGVNNFRRFLGLMVLVFIIANKIYF